MKMLMTHNLINMCIMIVSVFRWLQVINPERLSDALSHVLMSVDASAQLCTSAAMSVSVVLLRQSYISPIACSLKGLFKEGASKKVFICILNTISAFFGG